ncbi:MAG: glycosyltransferase family 4 protein [Anaerovoracaceae bacterium]|jgi:glycosyltransferase involved in cell wall biosynthesis
MNSGRKVLLISNNGLGYFNFKKELVFELLKLGYEVHFAVPPYEKLKKLVYAGAVYHEIYVDRRGINPVKDLSLILQFMRLIKTLRPDIIVSHTIKPNIYASIAAKRYKIPYINNITGLGSALQHNNALARILRTLYRYAVTESSGIFFENEGNREYFQRYGIGATKKYVLVPGAGVNIEEFLPQIEKHYAENPTFLFVGRIMKEKGIEEFLSAAEQIKLRYPLTKFQVVGFYDEPKYSDIISKLVDEEIIEFLGGSNDTRIEMKNADCIVLPSYHEGMSNVLLEGAAMGLPLITTNIPGCKEAVEDGKSGFLCKEKNTESLVSVMERFIALSPEERREMGLRGRVKMINEFDRRIVVEQYIKVINETLGETS